MRVNSCPLCSLCRGQVWVLTFSLSTREVLDEDNGSVGE